MVFKNIKIFFVISVIFYILLAVYLWYSLYSIRINEFKTADKAALSINSEINSAYSIDHSFSTPLFVDKTKKLFSEYPILSGIIIIPDTNGPEYIKLNESRLIDNPPSKETDRLWQPRIVLSNPFMKKIETPIYFGSSEKSTTILIFNMLDRNKFLPFLRNILIAIAFHLLITIVFLAITKNKGAAKKSVVVNNGYTDKAKFKSPSVKNQNFDIEENTDAIEPPLLEEDTADTAISASSGMYSERSGLVWEHFLNEKLDAELKRAASFDQDSCLAFIKVISPSGFIPYKNISKLIIEHFNYKDLAFESGENTFCVIIPDKDIDEGLSDIEKFKKNLIAKFPDSSYKIYAGLTSRNSRLLSEDRMIHEAKAALSRAESEPESSTISFRTDLNKYREYIASTL